MMDGPSRIDKVGVTVCAMLLYASFLSSFVSFRPNRIVQGQGLSLWESLPPAAAYSVLAIVLLTGLIGMFCREPKLRLGASLVGLMTLALVIGMSASHLTSPDNTYARISAASGFWLLLTAMSILATDAIARLAPEPVTRIGLLCFVLLLLGGAVFSGLWNDLSIMKEYQSRAPIFWAEGLRHVQLALGSVFAAVLIGVPLGMLCFKARRLRTVILNGLNIVQTIPSIALFGLLIAPLGWVAANIPGASELGIRGIGMAPAFVALFLYSLLPIVSNTVVGLGGVPSSVREAARGLGLTGWQRLLRIEIPLALPVILTGIRIVLVQNIGLATIAALIGGGGFGVFVFQGIGQTAMDLVLLGTIPTVLLGFAAAIILDAVIDSNLLSRGRTA